MPTEDHTRHDEEHMAEEHSFDVLARSLGADTLSRQRALKLVGAALLGGALSIFALPDDAQARRRKKKHRGGSAPLLPTPPAGPLCSFGGTCADCICNGCCDIGGLCQPGTSQDRCGIGGNECINCSLVGTGFTCRPVPGGGACQI
jgi:hypothetical protein